MPEMTKEEREEQARLVKEIREATEKNDAESKEKEGKLNARLDELEGKNQELVAKQLEAEKKDAETKEAMELLEKKLLRLPAGGEDAHEAKEATKAFEKFIVKGEGALSDEERKYLRTDSDPDGGYLAPVETSTDIIKRITEISPVRQLVRIRTTSRRSFEIPKRKGIPTAYRVGQGQTDTQSQSSYGMETINVERATVDVPISIEMLADPAFNMETEINQDSAEAFAKLEGTEFISGTGVGQMEGILTNADVAEFNSGVADSFGGDDLIDLTGELKDGYIGRFLMNRKTLAFTRKLKDGQGQYLWQNGLAAGLPNTINGDAYVSAIDMPDIAANAYPVVYGDFMRAYQLVDHTQTSTIRDIFSLAREGKVLFIMHRRFGGKVVLAESLKKLKLSV
jgi:HK97 family phage major capsid protein